MFKNNLTIFCLLIKHFNFCLYLLHNFSILYKKIKNVKKEQNAKIKALELTLGKLEKTYGQGVVMKLGDRVAEDIDVISSGSINLDMALGVGGYPKGRVIEIYGPESSGKTTLTIHAIAETQKQGGVAAFIDAEHAFDASYAAALGVDIDNLYISQPDNGEQALEIADHLISSGDRSCCYRLSCCINSKI